MLFRSKKNRITGKWSFNLFYCILFSFSLILFNHLIEHKKVFTSNLFCSDFLFSIPVAVLFAFNYKESFHKKYYIVELFKKANKFLADFSFSVYAFHLPLMYLFYAFCKTNAYFSKVNDVIIALLCTIYIFVISYIVHLFTEEKRNELKKIGSMFLNNFLKLWYKNKNIV